RGARFAVQEDRNLGIAKTDFLHECAQLGDGLFFLVGKLFVIDRQDENRRAALLLRKRSQVTITGDAEYFHALFFNGLGKRTHAEAAGILRAKIFVDDDDGKLETHATSATARRRKTRP